MNLLKRYARLVYDYLLGWYHASKLPNQCYQYAIEELYLKFHETTPKAYIRYKIIGCRTSLTEPISKLNQTHIFSLFRPDHAQMIVSIATLESMLNMQPEEVLIRYQTYIKYCATISENIK